MGPLSRVAPPVTLGLGLDTIGAALILALS